MDRTTMRAGTLVVTGLVAAAALGGCSSGSGSSANSPSASVSASVSAEAAAFCQSVADIQSAAVQRPPDTAAIKTQVETMKQNAPAALSEQVPVVQKAAQDPQNDPGPSFAKAFGEISTWIGDNCDAQVIDATLNTDGTVTGVPATAASGLTVVKVNAPDSKTVIGVARKNDGVTDTAAELLKMSNKESQTKVAFETSGQPAGVGNLTPGNYVVFVATPGDQKAAAAVDMVVS